VETEDGQIIQEFPPELKKTVDVSRENMELVVQALWGVCNEPGGTGHALRRKEADVCGKTGTAQVIGLPEGADARQIFFPYEYRDHALFVCFARWITRNSRRGGRGARRSRGHGGRARCPEGH